MTSLLPAPAAAPGTGWTAVVDYRDLLPERGVCVLLDGEQIAVFRTWTGALYALSNYDPVGRAYVLSRGIVGNRGDIPTIASPLYKHVFDLRTGQCLDRPQVRVPTFGVRCRGDRVELTLSPAVEGAA
jgi:nitrite reductase (NADH) small subunit